jgi:TrmH family RNA methyltransferase
MMRTAEAAGVTGVLMSRDTVDLFNPKTVRATMSAIFRVPFLYTDDLIDEIGRLREEDGIEVYAAHLRASRPYDEVDCRKPCAFLIGNEGNGLTEEAADAASGRVHIPMQGSIESLNAAMAAGILLFEAARQRRNA